MNQRLVFYFFVFLMLVISSAVTSYFYKDYLWLFSNSQEIKIAGFDWIYSAWGSSLGVHGTIAALSLTFISMVVDSINKTSPTALESFLRKKIIHEIKLMQFSIDAISTLIISFYFFVFGGGVFQYVACQVMSLYFIISYFKTYLNLFSIAKNKNYVFDFLHGACPSDSMEYTLYEDDSNKLRSKIDDVTKELTNVRCGYGLLVTGKVNICSVSKVFASGKYIADINLAQLRLLSEYLNRLKVEMEGSDFEIILPDVGLYSSCKNEIVCNYFVKEDMKVSEINKIESLMSNIVSLKNRPLIIDSYQELVEGCVSYFLNALQDNNKDSIRKSMNVLSTLLKGDVSFFPFEMLTDFSYQYLNGTDVKRSSIDEVMSNVRVLSVNLRKKSEALRVVMLISSIVLNKDDFNKFLKDHEAELNSFLSYDLERITYYELLQELVVSACNDLNYTALKFWGEYFNVNTRHLSVKYFSVEKDGAPEVIASIFYMQRIALTVLVMRWNSIDTADETNPEVKIIAELSGLWANLAIFSSIGYEVTLYDLLLRTYEGRYRLIIDERGVRDLPEAEAYNVTEGHYKIKALVFLFLILDCNRKAFNLRSLYDWKKLIDKISFTTSDYNSMCKACDSEDINRIIVFLGYDKQEVAQKTTLLKNKFEEISKYKAKEITRDIIKENIDKSLTLQFESDLNEYLTKWLKNKLDINLPVLLIDKKTTEILSCANKREFIQPLDGEHYLSSAGAYGEQLTLAFKHHLYNCVRKSGVKLELYDGIEIDKKNAILFVNRNSDKQYGYEVYKDYKMTYFFDDCSTQVGLYAVTLDSFNFSRGFDSLEAVHVELKEITKGNYHYYTHKRNVNDDDELFTSVVLKIYLNYRANLKDGAKIFIDR